MGHFPLVVPPFAVEFLAAAACARALKSWLVFVLSAWAWIRLAAFELILLPFFAIVLLLWTEKLVPPKALPSGSKLVYRTVEGLNIKLSGQLPSCSEMLHSRGSGQDVFRLRKRPSAGRARLA